jgi:hypothetical protein
MNNRVLQSFLENGINGLNCVWDPEKYDSFSSQTPPDVIFSGDASIKSDILMHWISWFCQSMCHLESVEKNFSKAKLYSLVRRGLENFSPKFNGQDVSNICLLITNMLFSHMEILNGRNRARLTSRKKQEIISVKSPIVSKFGGNSLNNKGKLCCWICGYKFCQNAIDRFLENESAAIELPEFVDVYMPRGLHERDLTIEVEHKIPFSKGGGDLDDLDNIELSCGWCNKYKSNFLSIYDANLVPKVYMHPKINKKISIPQPYWAIRKLAYDHRCSHEGCNNAKDLYITTRNPHGAATPLNLTVVCKEHDNFSSSRLVPRIDYGARLQRREINFY